MNPLLPILILLIGAGAMLTGLVLPRSRSGVVGLAPVIAAILAVFAALALGFRIPARFTVSTWPEPLFDAGLTLLADRTSWLFTLAILIAAAAVFLTGLSRPGGPRLARSSPPGALPMVPRTEPRGHPRQGDGAWSASRSGTGSK